MNDTIVNPFELKKEIRLVHGKKCHVMIDYSTSSYGRIAEILGPVDTTNWEKLRKEEEEAEKEAKRVEKEKFEQFKIDERNRIRRERDNKEYEMKKESKSMIEKRVVCGKARDCKMLDGKVSKVYDNNTKMWMFINDFADKYEPKKKDVSNDVKDIKKEETEEKKEEITVEIPKITVTTNIGTIGGTAGSSGTGTIFSEGVNIVSVPKVEKRVEKKTEKKIESNVEDKVKRSKDSRNKDMIDEYIDLLYGGT